MSYCNIILIISIIINEIEKENRKLAKVNKIKRKVGKECDLIGNIFVCLVYYDY